MSAVFSFLGGTAFRWLFGELMGFLSKEQDHRHEQGMIRLNMEADEKRSALRVVEIKAAADAGLKLVEAQAEAAHTAVMDQAWLSAVQGIDKPSGVAWVDAWNKSIRPALASISIVLIVGNAVAPNHVVLQGVVLEVVCAVLGLFVGGRINSTGR